MKYCKDFNVLENSRLNSSYIKLVLQSQEAICPILAGQFVHLMTSKAPGVTLRRPFSVYDYDLEQHTISLVIQIVGKQTEYLSTIAKGETINLEYPLGNNFPTESKKPLLVGGGIGMAPLYMLCKEFNERGIRPNIIIGARTSKLLFALKEFEKIASLAISTDDGSAGQKGIVTQNTTMQGDYDAMFCCGPTPMMKAVSQIAQQRDIDCYVSLEHKMACGIGACLCCVVDTTVGVKTSCINGPVFLSKTLKEF
jgi:2-polyprenylphenol hydroxylase and related flavodoxin oxidoreductases